jgi:hypothetical protein
MLPVLEPLKIMWHDDLAHHRVQYVHESCQHDPPSFRCGKETTHADEKLFITENVLPQLSPQLQNSRGLCAAELPCLSATVGSVQGHLKQLRVRTATRSLAGLNPPLRILRCRGRWIIQTSNLKVYSWRKRAANRKAIHRKSNCPLALIAAPTSTATSMTDDMKDIANTMQGWLCEREQQHCRWKTTYAVSPSCS